MVLLIQSKLVSPSGSLLTRRIRFLYHRHKRFSVAMRNTNVSSSTQVLGGNSSCGGVVPTSFAGLIAGLVGTTRSETATSCPSYAHRLGSCQATLDRPVLKPTRTEVLHGWIGQRSQGSSETDDRRLEPGGPFPSEGRGPQNRHRLLSLSVFPCRQTMYSEIHRPIRCGGWGRSAAYLSRNLSPNGVVSLC